MTKDHLNLLPGSYLRRRLVRRRLRQWSLAWTVIATALAAAWLDERSRWAGVLENLGVAFMELVELLAPLIAGLVIRQNVFSPVTTQKLVNRAAATQNTDIGDPPSGNGAQG